MQVAMRLGPYWWKRLGERKIYNSTVRICTSWGESLIAFTLTYVGLLAVLSDIQHPWLMITGEIERSPMVSILMAAIGASGIFLLTSAGVVFVKALFASLRFKTVFGFSPPVTDEGHKAVQLAVDRVLAFLAIARAKEYSREKELIESIRANGRAISECENTENFLEGPLQNIGVLIARLECDLSKLEKSKRTAEKNYYKTRDAARNPSLPIPFEVKKSFQDYFYLPKKEK